MLMVASSACRNPWSRLQIIFKQRAGRVIGRVKWSLKCTYFFAFSKISSLPMLTLKLADADPKRIPTNMSKTTKQPPKAMPPPPPKKL